MIVHIDHGIGKYDQICTLVKNGLKKDYIKLLYADDDILYLPVEKIDKITKFNGKEGVFLNLISLVVILGIRERLELEKIRKYSG